MVPRKCELEQILMPVQLFRAVLCVPVLLGRPSSSAPLRVGCRQRPPPGPVLIHTVRVPTEPVRQRGGNGRQHATPGRAGEAQPGPLAQNTARELMWGGGLGPEVWWEVLKLQKLIREVMSLFEFYALVLVCCSG